MTLEVPGSFGTVPGGREEEMTRLVEMASQFTALSLRDLPSTQN